MEEQVFDDIHYRPGDVILSEGEESTELYTLKEGHLSVFKGTEKVAEITEPDTLVGEMSFFLGHRRSATVVAESPSRLQGITRKNIEEALRNDAKLALQIATSLSRKLQDTTDQVSDLIYYREFYEVVSSYDDERVQRIVKGFQQRREKQQEQQQELLNTQSLMSRQIVNPLAEETIKAAQQVLGSTINKGEVFAYNEGDLQAGAASIINLIGECSGWFMMAFPQESAERMTQAFMGGEEGPTNEDIVSFIKELNNIIIGWIVGAIKSYSFKISTPTALFGESSIKSMVASSPAIVIPYHTDYGPFYTILYIEIIKGDSDHA